MSFYWVEEHKKQVLSHIDKHIFGNKNVYGSEEKEKWKNAISDLDKLEEDFKKLDDNDVLPKFNSDLARRYMSIAQSAAENFDYYYFYKVPKKCEWKKQHYSLNLESNSNLCVSLQYCPKNKEKFKKFMIATCFFRFVEVDEANRIAFIIGNSEEEDKTLTNNKEMLNALKECHKYLDKYVDKYKKIDFVFEKIHKDNVCFNNSNYITPVINEVLTANENLVPYSSIKSKYSQKLKKFENFDFKVLENNTFETDICEINFALMALFGNYVMDKNIVLNFYGTFYEEYISHYIGYIKKLKEKIDYKS